MKLGTAAIEVNEAIGNVANMFSHSPLERVIEAYHKQSVSYCYWKASRRLARVFNGDGDVDLLVSPDDFQGALAIAMEHGFKLSLSEADYQLPGTVSCITYDECLDKLIQLHIHTRLIIGVPPIKNYRVPWEKSVLALSVMHPSLRLRILDPETEAVLITIRAALEAGCSDPLSLRHRNEKMRSFKLDADHLAQWVRAEQVHKRAAELVGVDAARSITDMFSARGSNSTRRRLRRQLKRQFSHSRTFNGPETFVRAWSRSLRALAAVLNARIIHAPRSLNRSAPAGGCVVAILGIDGSGKSTSVTAIRSWLGSKFDVQPIYFGTGDGRPSLFFLPFKLALPGISRLLGRRSSRAEPASVSKKRHGWLYTALLTVWALAVALEKRQKLRAARRAANRGMIVVADRYPQDQIMGFNDGPLLTHLAGVPAMIRRWEANSYALGKRPGPDLVIKLIASPDVISRREPELHPSNIPKRIENLKQLDFPQARMVSIDAEQPLGDMIRAIRREVWRIL